MFEPHSLYKRWGDYPLTWSKYLNNDSFFGEADDAPWEGAALLKEWKKGEDPEMKDDDSYKKGEVASAEGHHKRKRSNETYLAERGTTETEFDYGLALYCVDCGTSGNLQVGGTVDASVLHGVTECSIHLNGDMQAGLNLGLNAYVKYEKTWTSDQKALDLYRWGVPGVATISPYIGIALQAKFGIEASGQLLIGATAHWDAIDFQLDLVSASNSHANGLVPRFEKRAEAKGELEIEASLGLPIELGLKVEIGEALGFIGLDWEAAVRCPL